MRTNILRILGAAAAGSVLLSIAACQKSPPSTEASPAPSNTSTLAKTATAGDLPDYFVKKWHVCAALDAQGWDSHIPKSKPYVEIVEINNGSGLYTLNPDGADWEKGWRSLALNVVGSEIVTMPPHSWPERDCKTEQQQGNDNQMIVTKDTIRLRGGTCLPDGNTDQAHGTCDNDVIDQKDPTKSIYHYHEVVIFARASGEPHLVLQHCGRLETENGVCKAITDHAPASGATPSAFMPHPGHVHLEN